MWIQKHSKYLDASVSTSVGFQNSISLFVALIPVLKLKSSCYPTSVSDVMLNFPPLASYLALFCLCIPLFLAFPTS